MTTPTRTLPHQRDRRSHHPAGPAPRRPRQASRRSHPARQSPAQCRHPHLAQRPGDRRQGPPHRLGRTRRPVYRHCRRHVHEPDLAAVPGFGEVHKHIESRTSPPNTKPPCVAAARQHLDLRGEPRVLQRRCARTTSSSGSRRDGTARPLKIFPQPGSAVPPTACDAAAATWPRRAGAVHGREPDRHRPRRGHGLARRLRTRRTRPTVDSGA